MDRVLIAGAGLTGLSAATCLSNQPVEFELCEASARPGGVSCSTRIEDTVFDTGVHIFYFQRPELRRWLLDAFDGDCEEQEKHVKIEMDGFTVDYPYQANLRDLPPARRIDSLVDLFEAAQSDQKPENFGEWLVATYGKSIAQDFLIPHNEKLMCVPASEISTQWAERFFPKPNLREIVTGAVQKLGDQFHPNQFFLYPRFGGAGRLAQSMASRLPVHYASRLVRVEHERRVAQFENARRTNYDHLVSTLPLPALLGALSPRPDWVPGVVERLRFSALSIVMIRTRGRSEHAENGVHWLYYPQKELPFQRLSFMENFAASNAPEGQSGLCLECTLPADGEVPGDLVERCLEGVERVGLCAREDVLSAEMRYLPHAYPLYSESWNDDMATVQEGLSSLGILSTGRYGAWKYSNMEDALVWGQEAASRVLGSDVSLPEVATRAARTRRSESFVSAVA